MTLQTWFFYLITEFVLSLTPGPAVLLVSSQGMKHGTRSSVYGALGISSGNLLYFIVSALGLGTLIAAAGELFDIIKYAGALYLVVTGIVMIIMSFREPLPVSTEQVEAERWRLFFQAFVTQISNPKAIIFFVALLPQFINPAGNIPLQFAILGLTTIIMETWILIFYGWLADKGKKLMKQNSRIAKIQDIAAGAVLIGIGINLIFLKRLTP